MNVIFVIIKFEREMLEFITTIWMRDEKRNTTASCFWLLLTAGCEKILWIYQLLFSIFSVNACDDCFSSGCQFAHCYRFATHFAPLSTQRQSKTQKFIRENSSFSFTQLFFSIQNDDMKSYNKYSAICQQLSLHWITLAPFFRFVLIQFAFLCFFIRLWFRVSLLLLCLLGRNRFNERIECCSIWFVCVWHPLLLYHP